MDHKISKYYKVSDAQFNVCPDTAENLRCLPSWITVSTASVDSWEGSPAIEEYQPKRRTPRGSKFSPGPQGRKYSRSCPITTRV